MLPNISAQVLIAVVSVPDVPEIVLPNNPVVMEKGNLVVSGLGMYDADVSRPGDEDLLFDVWLEAISGHLSLNRSTVRLPKIQICADEVAMLQVYRTECASFARHEPGHGWRFRFAGDQKIWHFLRSKGLIFQRL